MTLPPRLVEKLRAARRVAVLTGAGISAESGVPTFRDAQTGLWAQYDAYELATPEAFARNPKLVWDWYAWRRQLVAEAQPNPGHFVLAQMQDQFESFDLITQNVDGLHARAGSRKINELHGSIARICCSHGCGEVTEFDAAASPPFCPRCGAPLRPDVVWFGEQLPADALARAEAAAADCDLFFSIGTSAQVFPAADLPLIALQAGATVVEINPTETPLTPRAHFALRGKSGAVLPQMVAALG
jgi:NAD-dependent deacetylase